MIYYIIMVYYRYFALMKSFLINALGGKND